MRNGISERGHKLFLWSILLQRLTNKKSETAYQYQAMLTSGMTIWVIALEIPCTIQENLSNLEQIGQKSAI